MDPLPPFRPTLIRVPPLRDRGLFFEWPPTTGGELLRSARLAAGLSAMALGRAIGLSFEEVCGLERGAYQLSADDLARGHRPRAGGAVKEPRQPSVDVIAMVYLVGMVAMLFGACDR